MTAPRRFSLDTEFYPHKSPLLSVLHRLKLVHEPIVDSRLISLGIIDIDDAHDTGFYGITRDFNRKVAGSDPWIAEHVLAKLAPTDPWMSRPQLREAFTNYIPPATASDQNIEFWALNGSYDNYHLSQLFGDLRDLYKTMNTDKGYAKVVFRDVNELRRQAASFPLPQQPVETQHQSMLDATFQAHVIRELEKHIRLG